MGQENKELPLEEEMRIAVRKEQSKELVRTKDSDPSTDSIYLTRMKIDSFGPFVNMVVGPFSPGLNVVYGKNEAGKTTLNAFFGGVLFGWEDARGNKNTYKPMNSERSGTLFFQDQRTGRELEFSRVKNADGLVGPQAALSDIDKETYATMFALTSDELRSLKNTSDVTAKLLTAGSGTNASPAQALSEIQLRIAEYTSRASGIEHSLVHLKQQQEELREEISKAGEEAERYKKQDREFHELEPQRDELLKELETLNEEIETLTVHRVSFEKLEIEFDKNLKKRKTLIEEEQELLHQQHREKKEDAHLSQLSSAEELAIRDQMDILLEEQTKLEHRVSAAKDTFAESNAYYEALLEADDVKELEQKTRNQRWAQVILSIALPLLFVLSGIPVFLHGREINSLSFTALGIGLIVFAILLASAALVMLFRPRKADENLMQKKQDAQWVMLQDRKRFEACEKDLENHEEKIGRFLQEEGLDDAHGSLRRARALLDEAKEDRAKSNLFVQKQQALISQLADVDEALADITEQKEALSYLVAKKPEVSLEKIDKLIEQKTMKRTALTETSAVVNRRYGELKQELSHAKNMKRFDALKLSYQQVRTNQKERSKEYARLLLAKRMLESAISAWESKSQPEVYRKASSLLELMTEGTWVQVRMSPEGRLQVVDAVKTIREPMHLSLGTCQQLYLSLRIALLLTAKNVGRIIPIMADDILVNFDADRRRGAALALKELAAVRQVIIFTCHQEIVRLMQSIDSQANVLEL